MCTLVAAREAILRAREAVCDAFKEFGPLYGLEDADNLLQDAGAQISGEIAKQLPERPIYEPRP